MYRGGHDRENLSIDRIALAHRRGRLSDAGSLHEDTVGDVCIVGGGIAGLTTAYLLGRSGRNVILLEAEQLGAGETGRTTAHLASAPDDGFREVERLHGEEGAHLAAESHSAAIDRIETIAREENINCDFARVDGYLFNPPGAKRDVLDQERDAARRAGLTVEDVERAPFPSWDTGPCLRFAQTRGRSAEPRRTRQAPSLG
jgi:glycine/D-amino acid oxidase-like deaminating enzyme